MSSPTTAQSNAAAPTPPITTGPEVRIDAPHALSAALPLSQAVEQAAASAGHPVHANVPWAGDAAPQLAIAGGDSHDESASAVDASIEAMAQLRLQARQLAQLLRSRQDELDHREAKLNSQLATYESQLRAARIWFDGRQQESDARIAELTELQQTHAEREAELARRAADLQQIEESLDRRELELQDRCDRCAAELSQRERALKQAEDAVRRREAELQQQSGHRDAKLSECEQTIRHAEERLRLREAELLQQDAELQHRRLAVEALQAELREQAEALEARIAAAAATFDDDSSRGTLATPASPQVPEVDWQQREEALATALEIRRQQVEAALQVREQDMHEAWQRRQETFDRLARERTAELDRRALELANQNAHLASREAELDRFHGELETARHDLERREEALAQQQPVEPAKQPAASANLRSAEEVVFEPIAAEPVIVASGNVPRFDEVWDDHAQQLEMERKLVQLRDQESQWHARHDALSRREAQLAEAEALLAEAQAEWKRQVSICDEQRRRQEHELRVWRRQAADEQRSLLAEIETRQRAIERRAEQLDHQHGALVQSREEITALHREALELRLATEEMWAQLTGAVPPTLLGETLSETRRRLADHYRAATAELDSRKAELERLRSELSTQHDRLCRQAAELETWVTARRQELEQRGNELSAREAALAERSVEQTREREQLAAERFQWRQELRRWALDAASKTPAGPHLLGQLANADPAPATAAV
jgi:hypothetical protein